MDLLEIALIKVYYMMLFLNQINSRYEQVSKKENFHILPRKIKTELSNYLWKDVFKQIYDYYDLFEENKNFKQFSVNYPIISYLSIINQKKLFIT